MKQAYFLLLEGGKVQFIELEKQEDAMLIPGHYGALTEEEFLAGYKIWNGEKWVYYWEAN